MLRALSDMADLLDGAKAYSVDSSSLDAFVRAHFRTHAEAAERQVRAMTRCSCEAFAACALPGALSEPETSRLPPKRLLLLPTSTTDRNTRHFNHRPVTTVFAGGSCSGRAARGHHIALRCHTTWKWAAGVDDARSGLHGDSHCQCFRAWCFCQWQSHQQRARQLPWTG